MTEQEGRERGGEDAVYDATKLRGASNAKAKKAFGFASRRLDWLNRVTVRWPSTRRPFRTAAGLLYPIRRGLLIRRTACRCCALRSDTPPCSSRAMHRSRDAEEQKTRTGASR